MTIDREKLIHLLMEKTDMEKLEVESQLDELTNRILDAAQRGKALEIKGFGLFYFDTEGNLHFDVSDQLDKEINFKYAGMEPVELRPPRKSEPPAASVRPDDGEDEEKDKDNVSDDYEPGAAAEKNDPEPEPEAEAEAEDADDLYGISRTLKGTHKDDDHANEENLEPFGRLFQERSSDIEPAEESEIKKAGTPPVPPPSSETKEWQKKKKPSPGPMNSIIYAALGFVALLIVYILFNEYVNTPEQEIASQQQTIEVEKPPATAEQDITEPAESEPPEQAELTEIQPDTEADLQEQDTPDSEQPSESDRYGLYGEFTEGSGDEFAIVVHSLADRAQAEETAEELGQEGYRVIVSERTVDGSLYFRVGLGQFPSITSAQEAAASLPNPLNNQYFIQRLQ